MVKCPGDQQGTLAQSKRQALCPAFLGLVTGPEWGSTLFPKPSLVSIKKTGSQIVKTDLKLVI